MYNKVKVGGNMKIFDFNRLNDFKWDNEVISLIAQIHEHKGKQSLFLKQKPQVLDQLVEIAKIQSTESSNKIEGIVTTTTRIKNLFIVFFISVFIPLC